MNKEEKSAQRRPNLVFVFADQWRAQALGYAGDPNVETPAIDAFAAESVNFSNAVSGCPVCSPYRASLMTGQYPVMHGMVANDQCLAELSSGPYLAEAFNNAGYDTAYIGKWHIAGHGRSRYVPPERRLGFTLWKGCECTHDYNDSIYYTDGPEPQQWEGYDARAQTAEACRYIRERKQDDAPYALFLSWGPPHDPYGTAPPEFQSLYDPQKLALRANVPPEAEEQARKWLAGYYAHCSALDACFAEVVKAIDAAGRRDDTILIFTSDHGDMLGSRGMGWKQKPWDESIRVPFLIRDPFSPLENPRTETAPIDAPDLMPTLLGLCGAKIPASVQGKDFSATSRYGAAPPTDSALLNLPVTFHQWRHGNGGREYRGLRTDRYTYVRNLDGTWLLYDNQVDPYQANNLIEHPAYADFIRHLDQILQRRLTAIGDEFREQDYYLQKFNVRLNEQGDVFYE